MRIAIIIALLSTAVGALAEGIEIHRMIVGSSVMEVVQTKQLTFRQDGDVQRIAVSPDGKYAAFTTIQPNSDSADRIGRLFLAKLSGGKSILLMEGDIPERNYPDSHEWQLPYNASWSPDSRLIAFEAGWSDSTKTTTDEASGGRKDRKRALVFFDTAGAMTAAYFAPEGNHLLPWEWSPDSRRFAVQCLGDKRDPENGEHDISVIAYDVLGKRPQTLLKKTSRSVMIEGWIDGGEGLQCTEFREGVRLYRRLYLDGRPTVESEEKPDRAGYKKMRGIPFDIRSAEGGAEISDIATGKPLLTLKGFKSDELSALPRTRLVTYRAKQTIQGGPDGRSTEADSSWLMYPEGKAWNRMCVALGTRLDSLSSSDNLLRIGYVDNGRAFIAELELRKATPREKVAAGIRLTEAEAKSLMLENARQIADALESSIFNSEYYPSQEDFIERTKHHIRDANALLQPGTDRIAVTYFKPDEKYHIANRPPADTVIAVMDGGYGWRIKIFGDGRVEETP